MDLFTNVEFFAPDAIRRAQAERDALRDSMARARAAIGTPAEYWRAMKHPVMRDASNRADLFSAAYAALNGCDPLAMPADILDVAATVDEMVTASETAYEAVIQKAKDLIARWTPPPRPARDSDKQRKARRARPVMAEAIVHRTVDDLMELILSRVVG